jgi:hypothetical protein
MVELREPPRFIISTPYGSKSKIVCARVGLSVCVFTMRTRKYCYISKGRRCRRINFVANRAHFTRDKAETLLKEGDVSVGK